MTIDKLIKEHKEYAEKNGFKLNPNTQLVKMLTKKIIKNEKKTGKPFCPCGNISNKLADKEKKVCPCFWHKEDIRKNGKCSCGLFVSSEYYKQHKDTEDDKITCPYCGYENKEDQIKCVGCGKCIACG